MPTNEAIRWYADGGRFQEMGYGSPYVTKSKAHSNNYGLRNWVNTVGKHVFSLMHEPDVNVTSPPKRYWLELAHKSILRFRDILHAEQVNSNELDMRTMNVAPTPEPFLIYPCPYFRVRNPWAKRWCGLLLTALSEAMQHQDNLFPLQIHEDVARVIWQYPKLVLSQMAIEFFGKDRAEAMKDGFTLTPADFENFDEAKIFTRTDRTDTRAPLYWEVSAEDLTLLAEGIPGPVICDFLEQWPSNYDQLVDKGDEPEGKGLPANSGSGSTTAAAGSQRTTAAEPGPVTP